MAPVFVGRIIGSAELDIRRAGAYRQA